MRELTFAKRLYKHFLRYKVVDTHPQEAPSRGTCPWRHASEMSSRWLGDAATTRSPDLMRQLYDFYQLSNPPPLLSRSLSLSLLSRPFSLFFLSLSPPPPPSLSLSLCLSLSLSLLSLLSFSLCQVKLRVCPDCAIKLNYRKLKRDEEEARKDAKEAYPTPKTRNSKPDTRNPKSEIRNPNQKPKF